MNMIIIFLQLTANLYLLNNTNYLIGNKISQLLALMVLEVYSVSSDLDFSLYSLLNSFLIIYLSLYFF